jgi:hypothetical protein
MAWVFLTAEPPLTLELHWQRPSETHTVSEIVLPSSFLELEGNAALSGTQGERSSQSSCWAALYFSERSITSGQWW